MILVGVTLTNLRDKSLPDPRLASRIQRVAGLVPTVECAHDVNLLSVRRPDGKICSFGSINHPCVGAQALVQLEMSALVKQVEVVIGEQRHRRVPRRRLTFCGFARYRGAFGGASLDALCWLLGHFEGVSPARDLPYLPARYRPYCRPKTGLHSGRNVTSASSMRAVFVLSGRFSHQANPDRDDRRYPGLREMPGTAACRVYSSWRRFLPEPDASSASQDRP